MHSMLWHEVTGAKATSKPVHTLVFNQQNCESDHVQSLTSKKKDLEKETRSTLQGMPSRHKQHELDWQEVSVKGNTAQKISITWHKCDDCENEMTKANNNYANNAKYIPFLLSRPFTPSPMSPCLLHSNSLSPLLLHLVHHLLHLIPPSPSVIRRWVW